MHTSGPGGESSKPESPPPGRRSGEGLDSILPYLSESLRAKPQAPANPPPVKPAPPPAEQP